MKPPCCDKSSMKRGLWSEEEDAKIFEYVSKHGTAKWTSVSKKTGLGKSCRLKRNSNCMRADLKNEDFTPKEEDLIIKLHAAIGSRWSMIAQQLQGRTDNDVKSYWNTKLKKKLTDMGIDPVTHKPFSQIFASYGSVSGLSKPGTRIGSFNKDLRNAMVMPSPSQCQTIVSPKLEPNYNMSNNNNNSLDLLAELQSINLLKESSNYNFVNNHEPSSSSSSTCSSAAQDYLPVVAFNWNEFLLEDEFVPSNPEGAQDCYQEQNEVEVEVEGAKDDYSDDFGHKVSSSNELDNERTQCENSFVEALLAKESEMLMEFPDLMGDGFY